MKFFKREKKYSDEEIIRILREGKDEIMEEKLILHLYERQFVGVCFSEESMRILEKEEDRIDAYNTAVTKFIDQVKIGQYKGDSTLFTYFSRIFINRCIDLRRSNSSQVNYVTKPDNTDPSESLRLLTDTSRSILEELYIAEDKEFVLSYMKKKSTRCYQVVSKKLEGFTNNEIAQLLLMTSVNVRVTFNNCIKDFQNAIKSKDERKK